MRLVFVSLLCLFFCVSLCVSLYVFLYVGFVIVRALLCNVSVDVVV